MHLGERYEQTHHGKSYTALLELTLRTLRAPAEEASAFAMGNKDDMWTTADSRRCKSFSDAQRRWLWLQP